MQIDRFQNFSSGLIFLLSVLGIFAKIEDFIELFCCEESKLVSKQLIAKLNELIF